MVLTHYALKCVRDKMETNPKDWELIAISENGQELAKLHE